MKQGGRTSLGVDVTPDQVELVLVRRTETGYAVSGAAKLPMPAGAFENGRVADAAKFAKTLKALRHQIRTNVRRAALSLPIGATLTRVIPLTEGDPQRITQFINDEVKQYAAFAGRETVSDFRILAAAKQDGSGRALLAATDQQTVDAVARACRTASMRLQVVEPAIVASVSLFCVAKSPARSQSCMLLALLKGSTLTVCVFRRGILDFVRTKNIPPVEGGASAAYADSAEEINAVIRFYHTDGGQAPPEWSVVFIDDCSETVPGDAAEVLRAKITAGSVDFWTRTRLPPEVAIESRDKGPVSVTAVGSAVGLLATEQGAPSVNLMAEDAPAGGARRHVLLVANAVAVLVLVAILAAGAVGLMVKQVYQSIAAERQVELKRNERSLGVVLNELSYVEDRTASLSTDMDWLTRIWASRIDIDWAQLLNDVKNAVPDLLWITELSTDGTSDLLMDGVSHSYEAVHTFVGLLNRAPSIHHASVVQTRRDEKQDGLVRYTIKCTLAPKKAK